MTQDKISLGEKLPKLLAARGVDTVFGIPGVHTVELYRGLDTAGLRHITPRHEQGAGFMADGYARASGKPGVCFIISGPGMTNILTAMGQAYADSIPMLVISTVNAHGRMGSGEGWLHEMPDQSAMVAGVSAFSRTVHRADELEKALNDAFAIFTSARPRPVHIEIPINIMMEMVAADTVASPPTFYTPAPARAALGKAQKLLAAAQRPVILAGGGARAAKANVAGLAEAMDAPVVTTTNGRGLLPVGHPLSVPLTATLPEVHQLIAEADVVLALGTELGPTDYDMFEEEKFAIPGTLIRIDIDPCQTNRPFPAEIAITADAAEAAERMLENWPTPATDRTGAKRAAKARMGAGGLPELFQTDLQVLNAMRDSFPGSHIVGDSTQYVYAGNMGFEMSPEARYFNSACGFGTLGYGLPAAIGAAVASDKRVICLSGDGGLQFCLGELSSAVEVNAPVLLFLHDNQGYGEIKSYMKDRGIPQIGVDIHTPDLSAIAEAAGWVVLRPNPGELKPALDAVKDMDGPVMIYLTEAVRQSPFA
ncbi:MAG: 5-guanidino-2-oxopentanoate decarboxylase [Thalassovita sp.]